MLHSTDISQALEKKAEPYPMRRYIKKLYQSLKSSIITHRHVLMTITFLIQVVLSHSVAFLIRFEAMPPAVHLQKFIQYIPLLLGIRILFYFQSGLHKGLLRYASTSDLLKIIKSASSGSIVFMLIIRYMVGDHEYPRSIFILDWLLLIIITGGTRLFIRVFREYMVLAPSRKKMLIVGTGDAAEMIVREMKSNHDRSYDPVGFIDEDLTQKGLTIHGVPILGPCCMLPEILKRYRPDEVLIAASGDTRETIRRVYEVCKQTNVTIKKLPGIQDMLDGKVMVAKKLGQMLVDANLVSEEQVQEAVLLQRQEGGRLGSKLIKLGYIAEEKMISFLNRQYGVAHMKPISLEDLLLREPVKTDIASVRDFIHDKTVLVTGAGGSIGAELCRQIVQYHPKELLLFDRYENSTYIVDLELRSEHSDARITTIIGDIQDTPTLDRVFSQYLPQIVFHAAAYKHVPLMETNPIEAVKNNIFGTRNLIEASSRCGVESFVMISTDKAVNPTSIMGATKRVAEYLTVSTNCSCSTKFSVVRFGNVLGTNGSVIPIFTGQLKKGGPITVTHPDIRRFFMLIPEAVQLVLIAAAAGRGGEIYVLDMGSPIRIVDLAENLIRLSGFIPYKEIQIRFTGLRPGEKLYEDLFDESEQKVPTFHQKLIMAVPDVPPAAVLSGHLSDFEEIVRHSLSDQVARKIQAIVPNFKNETEPGYATSAPDFSNNI